MSEGLPSILLVDDDETFRRRLARALEQRGFDVRTAGTVDDALSEVARESPEFAVVDLRLPGRSGLELIRELHERDTRTRVVVLTGYGNIPTAVEATRLGAIRYLQKPLDAASVVAALTGTPVETGDRIETPSLARAEWEHIQRVLADCDGNISEAARRLGLHRRSLQRKLQKYPPAK